MPAYKALAFAAVTGLVCEETWPMRMSAAIEETARPGQDNGGREKQDAEAVRAHSLSPFLRMSAADFNLRNPQEYTALSRFGVAFRRAVREEITNLPMQGPS